MIIKSIVLAVILLLGSLGIAAAQSSEPHGTLGHGEPSEEKPPAATTQAIVLGWNFYHVFVCSTRIGVFFWVSAEDGSTWFTNDVATIATLTPSCQTENLVGFHVINASFVFDQVLVPPFK